MKPANDGSIRCLLKFGAMGLVRPVLIYHELGLSSVCTDESLDRGLVGGRSSRRADRVEFHFTRKAERSNPTSAYTHAGHKLGEPKYLRSDEQMELSAVFSVRCGMITIMSFTAVAVGAALLGLAMSVASKKGTVAAFAVTLAGLLGLAYGFFDGGTSQALSPPDIMLGSDQKAK